MADEVLIAAIEVALLIDDPMERNAELQRIAAEEFARAYTGDDELAFVASFANDLSNAWAHTLPESSAVRIASMIELAARNAAAMDAIESGTQVEWITMLDDDVRDLHRPLHGARQVVGQPFIVGGVPLQYPGQPVGPPEVWMNCRCRLSPVGVAAAAYDPSKEAEMTITTDASTFNSTTAAVSEPSLVARTFNAEQRRNMAQKGQAMPDGSFPIANEEDLRNAIQAIGRAKDPDAAKRHIKKRARALGLTDLIPESWTASGELSEDEPLTAAFPPGLSPPGTHDAPGWVTHPRETQRLRTYWTKGEGALKIRWGQPGDFDRCRRQLRKYVANPLDLAGTCANLHHVALGFWPGQGPHASAEPPPELEGDRVTAAFAAAAELEDEFPPLEWFQAPPLTAATPVTIGDDDEFTAHLATWDTCHVGITSGCTKPPRSAHNYAYFRTGEVMTAGGPVAVGHITMDTGHAERDLGPNESIRHYDDTGTVVADVAAGEDDVGIWVHGMLRPGLTKAQRHALRAGSLSGDWRRIGGGLELVAALVVNVPGFPIPRVTVAASADQELSLVAAGVVVLDPNAVEADRIATLVVSKLSAESERRQRALALSREIRQRRVDALVAAAK